MQLLKLEPLQPDDAPRLAPVALRAYQDHYLHLWHDQGAWYIQQCFTEARLRSELSESTSRFFLIHRAGEPVGFLKLNLEPPAQKHVETAFVPPANSLELERIYFVKAATGKGIGTAVLQQLDAYARQLGRRAIWLKAMDSSREAIAFYERNGYVQVGTHRLDFPQMKEAYQGMVILQKHL